MSYLEGGDEIILCDFRSDGLLQFCEFVSHHVPHPPGFILGTLTKGRHYKLFHILLLQQG